MSQLYIAGSPEVGFDPVSAGTQLHLPRSKMDEEFEQDESSLCEMLASGGARYARGCWCSVGGASLTPEASLVRRSHDGGGCALEGHYRRSIASDAC